MNQTNKKSDNQKSTGLLIGFYRERTTRIKNLVGN